MEQVYSGAYCVIAASRAPGHYTGFLQARDEKRTISLQQEGQTAPFYMSEAVDDFSKHVLDGPLNQRGWVLQEHALARRTIYFTDHQTYFECGGGVRCETLTKMNNQLASFLGDAAFPRRIESADQGEKIIRYQNLYKRYSRLELSDAPDREVAIDGLQERILAAIGAEGGFGVFDEGKKGGNESRGLLRRSLLWRRGDDTPALARIHFPPDHATRKVPSWSWMAYTGCIDYISPEFGKMEWEDLQSPWSGNKVVTGVHSDSRGADVDLVAKAHNYHVLEESGAIFLDSPGISQQPATKCVVLGRQKGRQPLKNKLHYLLVVRETSARDRSGNPFYARVGAGYLHGRCIERESTTIRIL